MPISVSPIIIRNNPPPVEEFVSSSNAPTLTYGLITSYSNVIQTSNVTVTNIWRISKWLKQKHLLII